MNDIQTSELIHDLLDLGDKLYGALEAVGLADENSQRYGELLKYIYENGEGLDKEAFYAEFGADIEYIA